VGAIQIGEEEAMTFAEVKKLVLSRVGPQYVSFTWENDNYQDGGSETVCRIYIDSINKSYSGQTWEDAYDRFAEEFCVPSTVTCSPCPTDEVTA